MERDALVVVSPGRGTKVSLVVSLASERVPSSVSCESPAVVLDGAWVEVDVELRGAGTGTAVSGGESAVGTDDVSC